MAPLTAAVVLIKSYHMAPEAEIIFINKSAKSKSLSRSNGLERARIFSHVQRIPPSQPTKSPTPSKESSFEDATAATWSITHRGVEQVKRPKSKAQKGSRANSQSTRSSPDRLRSPSPLSCIGLGKYDPFDTTIIPVTSYMNRVLEFCKHSFSPRNICMHRADDASAKTAAP